MRNEIGTHFPVGSKRDQAPLSAPVSIGPGAIQFNRMPYLPHSEAKDLINETGTKNHSIEDER